jgi:hypothetical protein
MEEDRERILKAVWNLKREMYQLLAKMHCRNVTVISPMEVLNVKDSVSGVRKVMSDGIHLDRSAIDKVVDHIIQRSEEHFVMKKRGPTERPGPVEKKVRVSSSATDYVRGGRGGGKFGFGRGGGGKGGRAYSAFNPY